MATALILRLGSISPPAVVWPRYFTKFDPAVLGLESLDQLGPVRQQTMPEVDGGQRGRQITQITRRCAQRTTDLPEARMGGSDRGLPTRNDQRKSLRVISSCFDANGAALGMRDTSASQGRRKGAELGRGHLVAQHRF